MKTHTITLRGQDFVFTDAAERELRAYLKELGRATVIQKTAYLECTEALREVLHDKIGGGKTVTKKVVVHAIAIVGVPPVTPENIFASAKLAVHDLRSRLLQFEGGRRDARRLFAAVLAFITLFAGIFIGAVSILLLLLGYLARRGSYQEFSYGVVRMTAAPVFPSIRTMLVVSATLFASGIFLTLCSTWLLRERHGLRPWIGITIGLVLFGASFIRLTSTEGAVSNLQSNRVYLQACNREIPMYLPESAPYSIYSQLHNEGYSLTAKIPTNRSNMLMDFTVLCEAYARYDQHPERDLVVMLYKEAADGSSQPFDQFEDVSSNWSFGLFAKP